MMNNKFKAFSINLNAKCIIGITPFHIACKVGQFDVVHQIGFRYQFECSTCQWTDSFSILSIGKFLFDMTGKNE